MLPHDEKKLSLSLVNNDDHLRQNYCEMERDKKLENYIPWVVGRDSFLCFEFRVFSFYSHITSHHILLLSHLKTQTRWRSPTPITCTQCDQIWRNFKLWLKIKCLWQFFECLFLSIWQNVEPSLANIGQCSIVVQGQIVSK